MEFVKQKPLEGVKVLLVPCSITFGSVSRVCSDAVDPARTDAFGKYELDFKTDGEKARISFENPDCTNAASPSFLPQIEKKTIFRDSLFREIELSDL